ncbi:hypothetical protein INT45_010417 [Circinella minor]|uniref:Adhesin domain-containing protein n=1 Tax=Circinella minor TaxID=1195481 RepID=A0A8H7RY98_9FUNG|nr:hypothetical protein INT45_010417 [Circinella minor]
MNYQSDYKSVSLLPSDNIKSSTVPDVCCRHRRLAHWATIISILSLVHSVYLRYSYSHHVNHQVEPYTISTVDPTPNQLTTLDNKNDDNENSLSSFFSWCPQFSDPWESVTTEFQVPGVTYQALNIEITSRYYIHFETGEANVLVDESIDETIVRFDVSFYNPNDKDLVEFQSEETPDGTLNLSLDAKHPLSRRIFLKLNVIVTISSPSILENLSIQLPNHHITVHGEQTPVFSNLFLATSNGHIETTKGLISYSNIILMTSNGSIKTKDLIGNHVQLSSANGHIYIGIDTLNGDLEGVSANGGVTLNAVSISGEGNMVELSSSNGHVIANLPDTFKSLFDVSTTLGKATVQSDIHPEKIHYDSRRTDRHIKGYYGDIEKKTNNFVKVSSSSGHSTLVFV